MCSTVIDQPLSPRLLTEPRSHWTNHHHQDFSVSQDLIGPTIITKTSHWAKISLDQPSSTRLLSEPRSHWTNHYHQDFSLSPDLIGPTIITKTSHWAQISLERQLSYFCLHIFFVSFFLFCSFFVFVFPHFSLSRKHVCKRYNVWWWSVSDQVNKHIVLFCKAKQELLNPTHIHLT